jgi:hypothetical protein
VRSTTGTIVVTVRYGDQLLRSGAFLMEGYDSGDAPVVFPLLEVDVRASA